MGAAWVPGGGRRESGELERMVIQSTPDLLGRVKGPVKTAPAGRLITSPGRAASRALWRSSPGCSTVLAPLEARSWPSTPGRFAQARRVRPATASHGRLADRRPGAGAGDF